MPAMCAKCFPADAGEERRRVRSKDGTWRDETIRWTRYSCSNPLCGNHPDFMAPKIEVTSQRCK